MLPQQLKPGPRDFSKMQKRKADSQCPLQGQAAKEARFEGHVPGAQLEERAQLLKRKIKNSQRVSNFLWGSSRLLSGIPDGESEAAVRSQSRRERRKDKPSDSWAHRSGCLERERGRPCFWKCVRRSPGRLAERLRGGFLLWVGGRARWLCGSSGRLHVCLSLPEAHLESLGASCAVVRNSDTVLAEL